MAIVRYASRADFRRHAKRWRSYAVLRASKINEAQARKLLERLTPEERTIASVNPDHSEAGRALAAQVGVEGGVENAVGAPPSWIGPEALGRGRKVFFNAERSVRNFVQIAMWSIFAVAFLIGALSESATDVALKDGLAHQIITQADYAIANDTQAENYTTERTRLLHLPEMAPYSGDAIAEESFSIALAVASLFAFGLWALLVLFRRNPARVLLLRRFNSALIEQRLRPFVRRTLSPYGQVYALADRYFKINFFGQLFVTFNPAEYVLRMAGMLWLGLRRPITFVTGLGFLRITKSAHFRRICERLTEMADGNMVTMTNRRRSIIVRTSDAWWRHLVLLFMGAADVIVMDVSDAGAGSDWEIDNLARLGLLNRTVFIAREEADSLDEKVLDWLVNMRGKNLLSPNLFKAPADAQAEAALTRHGIAGMVVHRYKRNGKPMEPERFERAMIAAVSAGARV